MGSLVHFWCSPANKTVVFACGADDNWNGDRRPEKITCEECKNTKAYKWWCSFYYLAYDVLSRGGGVSYRLYFGK